MSVKFANNGDTTLASGINDSTTSISVVDASVFPTISGSDYFYMTLEDLSANVEIVKVTGVSSNTLTVVRAQDGSTARAFATGSKAQNRLTAGGLNDAVSESAVVDVVQVVGRSALTDVSSVTNRSGATLIEATTTVGGPFALARSQPVAITQVLNRDGSSALAAAALTSVVARSGTITLLASLKTFFNTVVRTGYTTLNASGTFIHVSGRSNTYLIGF